MDRIYLPPHLVQCLISAEHKPAHTDQCKVEVVLELSPCQARTQREKKKSFWKLNTENSEVPRPEKVIYPKNKQRKIPLKKDDIIEFDENGEDINATMMNREKVSWNFYNFR